MVFSVAGSFSNSGTLNSLARWKILPSISRLSEYVNPLNWSCSHSLQDPLFLLDHDGRLCSQEVLLECLGVDIDRLHLGMPVSWSSRADPPPHEQPHFRREQTAPSRTLGKRGKHRYGDCRSRRPEPVFYSEEGEGTPSRRARGEASSRRPRVRWPGLGSRRPCFWKESVYTSKERCLFVEEGISSSTGQGTGERDAFSHR